MFVNRITRDRITISAPAKVNLFLDVLEKRPDGYHNINSLFQAVSLFDELSFDREATIGIEVNVLQNIGLPLDDRNLIVRAYRAITSKFPGVGGLHVTLDKRIPVAAGLGGGSSDAAATIAACNTLFDLGLNSAEMAALGASIGSDIPFFFTRGQALVRGRGEKLTETDFPVDYSLVLINPGLPISTAESYAKLKRDLTFEGDEFTLPASRKVEEFIYALGLAKNDFEQVHLRSYAVLSEIRDGLLRTGAVIARMSGSGPTYFGVFLHTPEIEYKLGEHNWQIYTVEPVVLPGQG